jgi:hypothetical protein
MLKGQGFKIRIILNWGRFQVPRKLVVLPASRFPNINENLKIPSLKRFHLVPSPPVGERVRVRGK